MYDTLKDGDLLLLVSNVFYRNPQQGDIIVASKESFDNGAPIVKRVIAVEGQTVDIDFDAGIVSVDGKPLEEPYTFTPTYRQEDFTGPIVVDEGCLFVMGDNRNDSRDSRSDDIGLIDRREVQGKAVFMLFPGTHKDRDQRDFSRIGVIS